MQATRHQSCNQPEIERELEKNEEMFAITMRSAQRLKYYSPTLLETVTH